MKRRTASRIYVFAAALCLVVPTVVPTATFEPGTLIRFVGLQVLLTGLPLSIMAGLLAIIHAQYQLTCDILGSERDRVFCGAALCLGCLASIEVTAEAAACPVDRVCGCGVVLGGTRL